MTYLRREHGTRAFTRLALGIVGVVILCASGIVTAAESGEKTVKSLCVSCHRIEGKPAARKTKKAPDLIWAGNKYRQEWLVAWLQKPEFRHYPVGYDFRPERKKPHLALAVDQAKAVAQYLATRRDLRIKEGVMKPGTPEQLARGAALYREHGCQNCHLTPANTPKGHVGGTSSTSLLKLNERLNPDWVYRFNQNPDDFEPESGAYIPKPPLPDEDIYAITAFMMRFQ